MSKKISIEEARQGEKSGVVRYVLAISLVLSIIAVTAVTVSVSG